MQDASHAALETFLVEDVILTLVNLRGTLDWIGSEPAGGDPRTRRSGLERLDRQLAMLETRAHEICRGFHKAGAAQSEAEDVGAEPADLPVFRSCRAMHP
jgi:hypothetical protein